MTASARLTITPPSDTSFAMPIAMLDGIDTTSIWQRSEERKQGGQAGEAPFKLVSGNGYQIRSKFKALAPVMPKPVPT